MTLPEHVIRKLIADQREVVADAKAIFDAPETQAFLATFGVKPEEMQKLHDLDVAKLDAMEKRLP